MANIRVAALCLLVFGAITVTAVSGMQTTVCYVINTALYALAVIGPTLVVVMFFYGAAKYIFSADDPGGRKAGKNTIIHSIIGGILILLANTYIKGALGTWGCAT
jgi:hypothetical protein